MLNSRKMYEFGIISIKNLLGSYAKLHSALISIMEIIKQSLINLYENINIDFVIILTMIHCLHLFINYA